MEKDRFEHWTRISEHNGHIEDVWWRPLATVNKWFLKCTKDQQGNLEVLLTDLVQLWMDSLDKNKFELRIKAVDSLPYIPANIIIDFS